MSALVVAGGHLWAATAQRGPGVLERVLWAIADTRHDCVILFFGLSGYLVGGGLLRRSGRLDLKAYGLARFTRIYLVLLPALALTAGLDGLAHLLAPHSAIYASVWPEGVFGAAPPFGRYGWREALASLLCLENVVGQPIGSDGPLWSLGFEWLFYLAAPAIMLIAEPLGRRWGGRIWSARAACVAASVAGLAAIGAPYLALLWLIWSAGACAAALAARGIWPVALRWSGALVSLLGVVLGFQINYRFADILIGFGFAAFLARHPAGERGWSSGLDRRLAAASYSLYVTHLPVVAFSCMLAEQAGILRPGGLPPGWRLGAILISASLAVGVVTLGFYWGLERNTDRLRIYLATALGLERRRKDAAYMPAEPAVDAR